jgi:hypothetical protein
MATITIECPASMVDQVKEALESLSGGEEMPGEEMSGPEIPEEKEEEGASCPFESEAEPDETESLLNQSRSNTMDKEALAQRRAERQAILAKISEDKPTRTAAAEGVKEPKDIGLGKDTTEGTYGGESAKPYQFSEKAQYEGEEEYPKMTLENSGGNSLKDNPDWAKIPIPTKNPESLQLKDSYENFSFSGGDDGSLEFSADFDEMNKVPSAGATATDAKFEVPTQLEQRKHKTTVAKVVTCTGCDNPREAAVELVECSDCGGRLALCQECLDEEYCPQCATTRQAQVVDPDAEACNMTRAEDDDDPDVKAADLPPAVQEVPDIINRQDFSDIDKKMEGLPEKTEIIEKGAELFRARIKTAYAVATQLALAKVIEQGEVDDQVKLWMDDGLSAKAMKTTGALMLRSAANGAERIAATAVNKANIRTASATVNPSFVASSATNGTVTDLKDALQSIFMERFKD